MKQADSLMPVLDVFDKMESEVRSYCRSFKTVFTKASNAWLWDRSGNGYIDFFAGAGALNYGHNNPRIRTKLIDYLLQDGVTHSLDMATEAKESFLLRFHDIILKPRGLEYKVMFPGPTGTNAVESALKIARKVTGRTNVICFTNAFHGMSLGSLAATGNSFKRKGAGVALGGTTFLPYDKYFGPLIDTTVMLERLLQDPGSGIDHPAAIMLETLQGEGGLNEASAKWLRQVEAICREHAILLIVDDVQMGCGRTGTFFSFEEAGIRPDIVCLSKSIGGYGLPMALTLIKPEHDVWNPGEHNGTFRGNNLGFVAATEALEFWRTTELERAVTAKSHTITRFLHRMAAAYPKAIAEVRGKGLIQGLVFRDASQASALSKAAFERGVILETSGPRDEVAKLMPPLTIEEDVLAKGLERIEAALQSLLGVGERTTPGKASV
ncbi:diaminobutyrate-2-oxoglutarate transaminase [Paenibacillus phyllosphaerae]|uniref:Diaminobutyrate--2-oxoglutarate transaminase n=1 Tax=Paenibacillus phyllosphaerae TaxID=274593 RepID=A0A7W5FQF5_9BACL|nr:diaminobutyrate--2-oxoglutarate transaminase [Paenibacillus phyllosphaerae]MBB3113425.1 diaminobutyrate-2-oxoglutarate transaminase [Paenibacillus phyllosphaerae]